MLFQHHCIGTHSNPTADMQIYMQSDIMEYIRFLVFLHFAGYGVLHEKNIANISDSFAQTGPENDMTI